MEVIKRSEAASQGLKRFYTGVPCGKNHTAERYTSSGNCVECAKKSSGAFAQALKASRYETGTIEYKRIVPVELIDTLDAVIKAHIMTNPQTRVCHHGKPPSEVCPLCDIGGGG